MTRPKRNLNAPASRDASQTRREEDELSVGGGTLVDPPADPQLGNVAVVEQQASNPMQAIQALQAMVRDMMQQQNDMQEQMRELCQQPPPGQLSYRQQLQQERESRELQIRHQQQLQELPPEGGQMGAGLPPPPPPQSPAAVGAAAAAAATPPGARGVVVDGRFQPSRPAGQSLPAVCVGDPVREYARFRAEGVDLDKSNAASGGLRPNNWMLPNSTFTVDSLDKKLDSFVTNHPAYDCLLYTSPSPRDRTRSRMPSSA